MPYYFPLRWNFNEDDRMWTARRLLALRRQLREQVPARRTDKSLLLATWNIRDFDSNKFRHGPRLKESFFYIAEIISSFDIVAIQEVNADLSAFNKVMKILGPDWDFIATDMTEGASGNRERMAFVYDRRQVRFQRIAGEIVLSDKRLVEDSRQFARTPFLVSFQSNWFRFMICTVHIYYGADTGAKLERRKAEIEELVRFLSKRADDESANYIVLGDFNIVNPEHETMEKLQQEGFKVPEQLTKLPSNMKRDKHYDQIAFKSREGQVQFTGNAGVFNFYDAIFRDEDSDHYLPLMANPNNVDRDEAGAPTFSDANQHYYENIWRTFQMSDHLPMWVELEIDFSEEYLRKLMGLSFAAESTHPLDFDMPELE